MLDAHGAGIKHLFIIPPEKAFITVDSQKYNAKLKKSDSKVGGHKRIIP